MSLCNLFPAKLLIFARRIIYTMAGVFEQLMRPQKRLMRHRTFQMNPRALELETAKEILAEVFRIKISDVDEMIQNRFKAAGNDDMVPKDDGLWPREFWLEG